MLSWLKFWKRGAAQPAPAGPLADAGGPPWNRPEGIRPAGPGDLERDRITILHGRPPDGRAWRAEGIRHGPGATPEEGPVLGIDLGTTHAAAAVVVGSEIRIIPNQEGSPQTPCVLARTEAGEWLVGEPARQQAVSNPTRTFHGLKRLLGGREGGLGGPDRGPVRVPVGDEWWPPQRLCALLLRKLREAAEDHLGRPVQRAVITVPAYCKDAQRQATLDAARIAGFDTAWDLPAAAGRVRQRMRLLNEPTAAALAYVLGVGLTHSARVAVVHLGGGTLDVAVLDVGDGVFQVESVAGEALGGDDFDALLTGHLADEFRRAHPGADPAADTAAGRRLREAAEQAKRDLSQALHAEVCLPCLVGRDHLQTTLHRATFEGLIAPLAQRCRRTLQQVVADARRRPAGLREVVLIGGMTRAPLVRALIEEVFGPSVRYRAYDDTAVAAGAAVLGRQLVLGARSALLVVDVLPQSLGVENSGGRVARLLPRNCAIPAERKQFLTTAEDGQTSMTLKVYEGEGEQAGGPDSRLLGEVKLEGLPPSPRGRRVEVTFAVDHNGLLDVTATDVETGRAKVARLFSDGGLPPAEVERLFREAEQERLLRVLNFRR
jgi:molecular chaperone DnaK